MRQRWGEEEKCREEKGRRRERWWQGFERPKERQGEK